MRSTLAVVLLTSIVVLDTTPLLALWESPNPGGGGQVQDIVCDPSAPDRLYLVSDMEDVCRSDDGGESWQISGDGLVHNRAFALAVKAVR